MAKTGEQLVDEIRALVGRDATIDKGVITDARCTGWLNDGQKEIARKCVGLDCLGFDNNSSLDTTQTLKYAVADITVGDTSTMERVNRIFEVYYLNGLESRHLTYMFPDEFDNAYPDPTHTNVPKDRPTHWTRRGGYVEIFPLCQTAYCDDDLRFVGDFWPHDLTTNDTTYSDICDADEGLIAYGTWKAWGAIGGQQGTIEELKWKKKFNDWLDDFKEESQTAYEWEGNMYGDTIE
jgi:hypothetical protein